MCSPRSKPTKPPWKWNHPQVVLSCNTSWTQGSVVPVNAPIAVVGRRKAKKVDEPQSREKPDAADRAEAEDGAEERRTRRQKPSGGKAARGSNSADACIVPAGGSRSADRLPRLFKYGPVKACPLAKKVARDNKVDLSRVQGTGPGGRVVRKDVEAALAGGQPAAAGRQPAAVSTQPVVVSAEDQTVQTTKLRQAIGRRLVESKQTIPHFYVTHEYKMDALMAMRKQANEYLPDNEKLSVNDFILKAVALTLRQFPNLECHHQRQ